MNIDRLSSSMILKSYKDFIEDEMSYFNNPDIIQQIMDSIRFNENIDEKQIFNSIKEKFGLKLRDHYTIDEYDLSRFHKDNVTISNDQIIFYSQKNLSNAFSGCFSFLLGNLSKLTYIGTILEKYDLFLVKTIDNMFSDEAETLFFGYENTN